MTAPWRRPAWLVLVWGVVAPAVALADAAPPSAPAVIASIELAHPFGTRSDWRFTATQGPRVADPFGSDGDGVPGAVTVCLHKGASGPCDPQLTGALFNTSDDPLFSERTTWTRHGVVRSQVRPASLLLLVGRPACTAATATSSC